MPTYTVHAPLPRQGEAASAPERFVFVRDGFHVWAFLLTPFWLLWRRLWRAFTLYILASAALAVGLRLIGAGSAVQFVAGFLVCAADRLRGVDASAAASWPGSGWTMLGFVIGEDTEMAERRFFAEWAEKANSRASDAPPPAAPEPRTAMPMRHDAPPAIIGLFPEPEGPR